LFKLFEISLLPKSLQRRDALNSVNSNIKPRFSKRGLRRLGNIQRKFLILGLLSLFLLGYQPALTFPPLRQEVTFAVEEQVQEIGFDILPVFQLPHPGYLSTKYSRFHPGIDIATGLGMPIHPVSNGQVVEVNFGLWGYGNHVIIEGEKGFKSLYGHMGRVYVKKDQEVSVEDTLGTVGMSGFTSGPHTHLEIYRNGNTIDPVTVLPKLQDFPAEEYLRPYTNPPSGGKEQPLSKTLKPDFR